MSQEMLPISKPTGAGRRVEVISMITIAVAVLFGGRPVIEALERFPAPAGGLLFIIALAQGASLVRTLQARHAPDARMRASRDSTALVALLFAFMAVLTRGSWAIGTAVAAVEFACVLEILRLLQPNVEST